uniref:Uncharacterized protein n=2 Tax=Oryza sativa subsp. japonica TaxID=39947 RepID=Q6H466_ORYSJ|nr:hypothetical protein [Oryza sativa Japonica Group]
MACVGSKYGKGDARRGGFGDGDTRRPMTVCKNRRFSHLAIGRVFGHMRKCVLAACKNSFSSSADKPWIGQWLIHGNGKASFHVARPNIISRHENGKRLICASCDPLTDWGTLKDYGLCCETLEDRVFARGHCKNMTQSPLIGNGGNEPAVRGEDEVEDTLAVIVVARGWDDRCWSSGGEEQGIADGRDGGGAMKRIWDAEMTRPQSRGEEARQGEAGVVVDGEETISIQRTVSGGCGRGEHVMWEMLSRTSTARAARRAAGATTGQEAQPVPAAATVDREYLALRGLIEGLCHGLVVLALGMWKQSWRGRPSSRVQTRLAAPPTSRSSATARSNIPFRLLPPRPKGKRKERDI